MLNATEIALVDQDFKAVGLAYTGPLVEVVIWRDEQTRELQYAQPGEYIVRDIDGYARRWSATDFAALFDTVAAPSDVSAASVSLSAGDLSPNSFVVKWTDSGALAVRVYGAPDYRGVAALLGDVANGVKSFTVTDLAPGQPLGVTLKAVDALGAEASGVTVTGSAQPSEVPADGWTATASASTVVTLDALPVSSTLGIEVHVKAGAGAYSLKTTVAAGKSYVVLTGLTASTAYKIKLRYVTAQSTPGGFGGEVSLSTPA